MSERTQCIYIGYQNAKIVLLVAKVRKQSGEDMASADAIVDDILTAHFFKTQPDLVAYLEAFDDGAEGKVRL